MSAGMLPTSPEAFAEATWEDIAPYYEGLATRPLDRESAEGWLVEWSALEELLSEAVTLASIAYTADTTDPVKEARRLKFARQIAPRMRQQRVRLIKRLLDLGYTRADLETTIRQFRAEIDLFRPDNLPLLGEVQQFNAQYQKVTGALTVQWDGAEKTVPQLRPFQLSPDRAVRERAFRLVTQAQLAHRDQLADIFDRQYALRAGIARNAGFASYREYAFRELDRFDYTPADCERFHAAVEEVVVPAVRRRYERRRRQMGLDQLRPWDTGVDPLGRQPLRPFDDVTTLIDRAAAIFRQVDPVLGGYFRTMADEQLLDLDSRKGKAPGGYCTTLEHRGRPFIFMNAVGVGGDVQTLLHEAGHAFHAFEAHARPLVWQRHTGQEMAEVAAMTLELLTAPYLESAHGGYYSPDDARRARVEQLESTLLLFPHMAAVDAFQHWLYTSDDGGDRDARDTAWLGLRRRFESGIDWEGLEAEQVARWYFQPHIFLRPFYYIEYGIAQLGALQVWRNSLRDPQGALAAYRRALALGGTRPLPELFAAAGARLAFDAGTIGALVALVETRLAGLED